MSIILQSMLLVSYAVTFQTLRFHVVYLANDQLLLLLLLFICTFQYRPYHRHWEGYRRLFD